MSRKDYIMVAAAIAALPTHAPTLRQVQETMHNTMADCFARDNARFDRSIFRAACKLANDSPRA